MKFFILFLLLCKSVFAQNFFVDSLYKSANQTFEISEINFFSDKIEARFLIQKIAKVPLSINIEKDKKKEIFKNIGVENGSNLFSRVYEWIHYMIL